MNICLLGFTDKRPVIYSFLKVLGQAGRTLLISPNLQYSQLSEHYEQDFEVMGVRVVCEPISFGEILSELETEEYNYIVFDCLVEVPEKIDIALIQDNLEYYRELLDGTDEETYKLFINKSITTEKTNTFIMVPAATVEKTCQQIEKLKQPYPFASSAHNKMMSSLLGQILQMPPANILKYLKRGVK
jgi:hypothetical protein